MVKQVEATPRLARDLIVWLFTVITQNPFSHCLCNVDLHKRDVELTFKETYKWTKHRLAAEYETVKYAQAAGPTRT